MGFVDGCDTSNKQHTAMSLTFRSAAVGMGGGGGGGATAVMGAVVVVGGATIKDETSASASDEISSIGFASLDTSSISTFSTAGTDTMAVNRQLDVRIVYSDRIHSSVSGLVGAGGAMVGGAGGWWAGSSRAVMSCAIVHNLQLTVLC